MIKIPVVNPIVELTEHILYPQNEESINRFITKIEKKEYNREFKIK
jgi:hypothetical protein